MSLAVGSAATQAPSQRLADERQYYPRSRYHPYQRSFSHKGSPTSHRETHLKATTFSANAKCQYFQAKLSGLGDLGVARLKEDPFEYAARMAARGATAEESEAICPPLPSPTTHLSYQVPACATKINTLALLEASPLLFANYGPPTPSFVFAASVASEANMGPHSLAQSGRSSPQSPPIEISANTQARIARTDREKLAQRINEHLETNAEEPIVGSVDNPFPLADQYGIKGVSVLSVFFHHLDMSAFTCHFCGDKRGTIDDALEHQRAARHYNE